MGALETFGWEWGSALLRWLHVTAAIAWIGGSFFFMHLDASLRKRAKDDPALAGVSWQVHGGGFYEMRKYLLAPAALPEHLIWHKWQSYWTWISGFALLCWVYYGQSSLFLIDPAVMPLEPWQAALRSSRWRLAGSSTISCAARRSPPMSRCSRSSDSAMSWRRAGCSRSSSPAAARSSTPAR